ADEMLYRAAPDSLHAQIDCGLTATVRACSTAFYEIGLQALVGDRLLFFNAPREWLLEPDLLPPCSNQLVIEVLESVTVDNQLLRRLEHLREQGYRLALDDFVLTEQTRPLLELADIIKVDMLQPQDPASLDIYRQHGCSCWRRRWRTWPPSNAAGPPDSICSRGTSMPVPRSRGCPAAAARVTRRRRSSCSIICTGTIRTSASSNPCWCRTRS